MMIACAHAQTKQFGFDRKRNPRVRCLTCGKTWTIREASPLGKMQVPLADAKLVLSLLTQGNSIRATTRIAANDRGVVYRPG